MTEIAIVLNIILMVGIIACQILTKKSASPKIIALVVTFLCGFLGIYSILMLAIGVQNLISYKFLLGIIYMVFGAAPFIIGNLSTYKREGTWILIQELVFGFSLILLMI